ncbi:MAG TPA: glycine--tRNA ligase subunit beta [Firmicutes bacterium]|nr:glycine--tRNA ligase subunit beta [Bacillota bacterium]
MHDFLLELGFEELPARFVPGALTSLSKAIRKGLRDERLAHGEVQEFSTPRRLAVLIKDLQAKQADLEMEVKGPPKNIAYDDRGQLTRAGQGFLRSQGAMADDVVIKQFQGADYLYIKKKMQGKQAPAIIKPLLEKIVAELHFPKNMRWGDYDLRFARPLRWIVCLLGEEVIPLDLGMVQAGRVTFGHRQLSSRPITVTNPGHYLSALKNGYVLADTEERERLIRSQIRHLAAQRDAVVADDESLLLEVLNLVEYPTAFCGEFSSDYLQLPTEVLTTTMKTHQRYFPLKDSRGRLLPSFIGVRNGADNHLNTVIAGNEKVLAARLADARFFYNEDQAVSLADNVQKLDAVVFQDGLGSIGDKVRRLVVLSGQLGEKLGYGQQRDSIVRAAKLAKADLVTQMVGEFPELQGIMGEKYALLQGEPESVAAGIREHYQPRFAADDLPLTAEGIVVSLADKIDTLVGYFALGKIPTGSQDPFALRRQAQGVVQILLQGGYALSLQELLELAGPGYEAVGVVFGDEAARSLRDFLLARLRVFLLEQGYRYDLVDAVIASEDDRPSELRRAVQALTEFIDSEGGTDLMIGFERIVNLAAKAERQQLNRAVFQTADSEFFQALSDAADRCRSKLDAGDYHGYLRELAALRAPIDRFFTDVMIMDSDSQVRSNRLGLLQKALKLYTSYGDFNQIVVNK